LPFFFRLGWLAPWGWGRASLGRGTRAALVLGGLAVGLAVLVSMWFDYKRVERMSYADTLTATSPARPTFWFRDIANATYAAKVPLARATAPQVLEMHMRALHLLPTPQLLRRTATLLAMTGQDDEAMRIVDRLHYYYNMDMRAEIATLTRDCRALSAQDKPLQFCREIERRNVGLNQGKVSRAVDDE
jgi:hypothetical protein